MAALLKSSGHQPYTCFGDGLSSLAGIVYSSSKTVFFKIAGLQLLQLISVELQSQCRWNKLLWKLQACRISGLRNSSALHYLILMKTFKRSSLWQSPPTLHPMPASPLFLPTGSEIHLCSLPPSPSLLEVSRTRNSLGIQSVSFAPTARSNWVGSASQL